MRTDARLLVIVLSAAAMPAGLLAQAHPHFNDGGTLPWYQTLAEAQAAAKKADKVIFVEYGRAACGNCRALAERVLPSADIKGRMGAMAIGLAADCDNPEDAVSKLMREHLPNASTLPFVGFITVDGKWVDGFSGFKDAKAFAELLGKVETSPVLAATPAVRKQLEKIGATAVAAAERSDWKTVLGEVKKAAKSSGLCPEREAVKAAEKKARDWAVAQLDAAVQEACGGGDLAEPRKRLVDVKTQFAGEPEFQDAETGSKAMNQLALLRDAEARSGPMPNQRDKAAATFKGTRWAAVFAKAAGDKTGK